MQATDEDYARRDASDNLGTVTLNKCASSLANCSCALTRHPEWRTARQPRYPALRKIIGGQLLRDNHAPDVTELEQTRCNGPSGLTTRTAVTRQTQRRTLAPRPCTSSQITRELLLRHDAAPRMANTATTSLPGPQENRWRTRACAMTARRMLRT